jgi:hypothetical protein
VLKWIGEGEPKEGKTLAERFSVLWHLLVQQYRKNQMAGAIAK